MKKTRRALSLFVLCAMMLTLVFSATASAEETWNGVKWEYEPVLKALYIRCEGVMPVSADAPWQDNAAKIRAFIFDNGLTELPAGFTDGCDSMDTIMLPATVRSIGDGVLTVGKLGDVWYEGTWEEFTKIEMSDEDMAAVLQAKFHGSEIVYRDDGSFEYVETRHIGRDWTPGDTSEGWYVDLALMGTIDPRFGLEIDMPYKNYDGKRFTTKFTDGTEYREEITEGTTSAPTKKGGTLYQDDTAIASGETVYNPDGTSTHTVDRLDMTKKTITELNADDKKTEETVITPEKTVKTEFANDGATKTKETVTTPDGTVTETEFADDGETVTKTTVTVPTENGKTVTETIPDGPITVTEYNQNDKKTKETVTTPDGTVTEKEFADDGETVTKTTVTVPTENGKTVTEYDKDGNLTKETTTEKDNFGNVSKETVKEFGPGETLTKETITETDLFGNTTITVKEYDENGVTKETVTNPNGTSTETEYKEDCTVVTEKDTDGKVTKETTTYTGDNALPDTEGRVKKVVKETLPDGTTKTTYYDKDDNETTPHGSPIV